MDDERDIDDAMAFYPRTDHVQESAFESVDEYAARLQREQPTD